MCCFSQPVIQVSNTRIFARRSAPGKQILVYSMRLDTSKDLAMILPIPTVKKSDEHAVHFIDLAKYSEFFEDLAHGFPDNNASDGMGSGNAPQASKGKRNLDVVEVGSYKASFVPSIKDFSRLDKQFRLPEGIWDKIPAYKDFGFAVFKLKAKDKTFHPMAFEFPTALPTKLFFPTMHIHDGKVHEKARFDHTLYCQLEEFHPPVLQHWEESARPVGMFMDYARGMPAIERFTHVLRRKVIGMQKNQDTLIG